MVRRSVALRASRATTSGLTEPTARAAVIPASPVEVTVQQQDFH
ncbi:MULTISPECIES: hypothetical protein [Mycobacterium simiae complex]